LAAQRTAASSVPSLAKDQTPWLPLADSGPRHEPHAVHARISPPGTSLRCSMSDAIKATAHENKMRWQTFTPPQRPAYAAHCGLVLHWRAYLWGNASKARVRATGRSSLLDDRRME